MIKLAPTLCGLGFAICVILWCAGFLGQWWLPLDIFSHFRWHIFLMAIVLCLAGLSGRGWIQIVVIGLFLIYTAFGLSPYLARALATQASGSAETARGNIKLLSFNSWIQNQNLAAIEAMLRKADADVVLMQEFFADKAPLLDRLRDLYPHQALCRDTYGCSQVTLSRYPIASHETIVLEPELPVLVVRFDETWPGLEIANIHTLRPPYMSLQLDQMKALAAFAARRKHPLIVAGDFNSTPYSLMFETFREGSGLRPLQYWPTWPAEPIPLPQLSIDHFFVSDHLKTACAATPLGPAGSDHLPIAVTLTLGTAGG
jgi:endonuclease/exonuclease/phosphatase (EEP) superfamily protein YafD